MDFKILFLLIGTLLPIVSTDCAAAKEATNSEKFLSKLFFKHNDTAANIASPAPTLSTIFDAKAAEE